MRSSVPVIFVCARLRVVVLGAWGVVSVAFFPGALSRVVPLLFGSVCTGVVCYVSSVVSLAGSWCVSVPRESILFADSHRWMLSLFGRLLACWVKRLGSVGGLSFVGG